MFNRLALALTPIAFTAALGCTQLLGDVCVDEPGKPCEPAPEQEQGSVRPDEGSLPSGEVVVAPPLEPCTEQGALRCLAQEFQRCEQTVRGLGWLTLQACRTDALCMGPDGVDRVAGCIQPSCDNGQFRCEGSVLQQCSDELTGYLFVGACPSAAHCDSDVGLCAEAPCSAGQTRCNDRVVERCNDTETAWEALSTCETQELCEATRASGSLEVCQAPACEVGEVRCAGSVLEQCDAGRTGFVTAEVCATAALCEQSRAAHVPGTAAVCIEPACEVGEHRCAGAALEVCNDDRMGYVVERVCEGPPFCNAAMADVGVPAESPGCLAAPCQPGEAICNGAQPEQCRDDQLGFSATGPACASRDLCIDDAPRGRAFCRDPVCRRGPGTNEFRCVGAALERCNDQLTGYVRVQTCETPGLCAPRAQGCLPRVCAPGQRRCNNGVLEVCNNDLNGFRVENDCGGNGCRLTQQGPQCNECVPGSGAACANGDVVSCNGGVRVVQDCGAAGCRATPQGPLCNQCSPGSPPACVGGDLVTCNGGTPQITDCGAAGCRDTAQGPVCNECVPGSPPSCTNGDIVICNAGARTVSDCGAPGCRGTAQGPVCNQCVPGSAPSCDDGDIVACNASGNPVVTDCGAPGCRQTPQGPVCNQCVVGSASCNDGDACTTDACVAPGVCSNEPASAGTACGGGNVCDGRGACVQCTSNATCDDGNACTVDACSGGGCTHTSAPAGTACGGGNVCNGAGVCVQCTSAAQCDDGNPCTSDACNGGVCAHAPAPAGSACGGDDVCNGFGVCVGCTSAAQCDDGDPCTSDACSAATSTCVNTPAAAGTPCGNGDVCSANGACVECTSAEQCGDGNDCTTDACVQGVCQSTPRVGAACGALAACSAGECDASGACVPVLLPPGTPCGDDGVCNAGGACVACAGSADCDDQVGCTVDSCGANGCSNVPDPAACDDDNECTSEACDAALGCVVTPLDGAACGPAGVGVCNQGVCELLGLVPLPTPGGPG